MAKHYQVVIKDDGKTFVRSLDGAGQVSPDESKSIGEKIVSTATEPSYVYIGYQASTNRHKIGLSIKPPRRAKELDIEILHTVKCQSWGDHSARRLERCFHDFFRLMGKHIEGEWFHLSGFDVWNLKIHDNSENGAIHRWYQWILEYMTLYAKTFNEAQLPDPLQMVLQMEREFLDYKIIRQVAVMYHWQWAIALLQRANEKTLAGFMREYSEAIEESYMKEHSEG